MLSGKIRKGRNLVIIVPMITMTMVTMRCIKDMDILSASAFYMIFQSGQDQYDENHCGDHKFV